MKKLLLFLLVNFQLSIVNFTHAQITITNANMPASNDTIRYSNTSTGISYDVTGANYTWDFSTLTPISQGLCEYKPSSAISLVYSVFFGFGSYGLKTTDSLSLGAFTLYDLYDFYTSSSTAFKAVGRGMEYMSVPVPSNFTDDDEIYTFPLDYTDYDSTTFSVSFSLATTLELFQKGYRINEVEGWGTVITPHGTYQCLKVKSTVHESDSLVVSGFGLPAFSRVTRQYKWLAATEKIPVFEVNGNMVGATFIPTYSRYRDSYAQCLANTPSVAFSASQTVGTTADIFDFSNTTTCAQNYLWTITPNTFTFITPATQTSATPSVQFSDTGYYKVKLTAINALGLDSSVQANYIHITDPAGVPQNVSGNNFSIFPNPSAGTFIVRGLGSGVRSVAVYNILGEKLEDRRPKTDSFEIDLSIQPQGIYFLKLQTENGTLVRKVVVE